MSTLLPAALVVAELLARALGSEEGLYHRTYPGKFENNAGGWARVDPDLGWVFSGTNTNTFMNPRYRDTPVGYVVNAQGFRDRKDFDAPHPAARRDERLLLLGDSFVFGTYIEERDTLAQQLESRLSEETEVYSVAIPGWGLDQMLLAYRKFAQRIDPGTVVLAYIDDDVPRVYEAFRWGEGLNKPSFRLRDGELIPRTATGPGWLERAFDRSYFLNRLYRNRWRKRVSLAISRAVVAELARACEAQGRRLVVLRYPEQADLVGPRRNPAFSLESTLEGHSALYLDPRDQLMGLPETTRRSYYLEADQHPSPAGNAAMAEWLVREAGLGQVHGLSE